MADAHKWPEINHQERTINPPAVVRTAESLWISQKTAWNMLQVSWNISKTLERPDVKKDEADSITWSKEERLRLKEELLISEVRKKLIAKYPEQKDFFMKAKIKVMQLWKNIEWHNSMVSEIGGNIFLLFSLDWKLLSYLNSDWTINFDISKFNFDDDFWNLLNKSQSKKNWNSYIINKDWKLFLYNSKGDIYYPEWSHPFNVYIFAFYLKTLK